MVEFIQDGKLNQRETKPTGGEGEARESGSREPSFLSQSHNKI